MHSVSVSYKPVIVTSSDRELGMRELSLATAEFSRLGFPPGELWVANAVKVVAYIPLTLPISVLAHSPTSRFAPEPLSFQIKS